MRPAFAAIPDAYIELALGNDAWFAFVSLVAMVIHATQVIERAVIRILAAILAPVIAAGKAVERTVLRLVEDVILYPLRRILHTYQHGDPTMIEYYSSTCAVLFGLWIIFGRAHQTTFGQQITAVLPWWIWANPAMLIGLFQGVATQRGDNTLRSMCNFFAFLLWAWLSAITFRRLGFTAIHAFTCPLMLACWIVTFMHLRGQNDGQPHTSQ